VDPRQLRRRSGWPDLGAVPARPGVQRQEEELAMKWSIPLLVALGALAYNRRTRLKDDAARARMAGMRAVAVTRSRLRAQLASRRTGGMSRAARSSPGQPTGSDAGVGQGSTTARSVAL
jgi:hypothetical protein